MYVPENDEERAYLAKYDPNKYPKPSVTVDFIVHIDGEGILFVKRKNFPYRGKWALPGGFLDVGKENTLQAAVRELKEETSLDIDPSNIVLEGVYSDPQRDPRDHVVSIVYSINLPSKYVTMVKPDDDAAAAGFVNFEDGKNHTFKMEDLAFDHKQILEDYFNKRR